MSRVAKDLADSAHRSTSNGNISNMQSLRRSTSQIPNVAVIGAGMAGLRCSDVLIRSGARVTVFEARDRIGGRVHQMETGGHLVDMGPNWIHGTNGNPIMKLAERTNTVILEPDDEDQAVFDAEGKRLQQDEAGELSRTIWGMIVKAFKYSDENSAHLDSKTSLYDYFREELSRTIKDEQKLSLMLKEAQMWGPFVGDPIETQSLKFFFLEECIDGENVFVASTYKNILGEVSRTPVESKAIHFNTSVKNFELQGEHGVRITTSSGKQYAFDEVVVTCPLGWLKRNKGAFVPGLPPRLSQAIDHINYGRLEKLYVTFPHAFWLLSSSSSTNTDKSNYPIFTHFHSPTTYVSHLPESPWNQTLVSLAHLPDSISHPTLLFYIYGPCATDLVHTISKLSPHSEPYNSALDSFIQPFYSLMPNYSPTEPACKPTSFLCTTWQSDPYSGNGSYVNFQVGLERGDEDIEVMRESDGLWQKGLWLAGEHTAPFVALGTTTGAYWSGEAVARRICKAYGINVADDDLMDDNIESHKKRLNAENGDAANMNGLGI